MFDDLKARLERFLAEQTADNPRARALLLKEAILEAKVGVRAMRDALGATERELEAERGHLRDAERRGTLAADIGDAETVEVAGRFAGRHRDRVAVLERRLEVQREELALAERDVAEMTAQLRAAQQGVDAAADSVRAAWDAVDAAGGGRPGTDPDDDLRRQTDRAAMDAAIDAQLAHLKRKLGKEPS